MTPDLDALRARFPHLGFGVYAYEPGAGVTLEIHMPGGHLHSLSAPTLAGCIAEAFPETIETTKTDQKDQPISDPFG